MFNWSSLLDETGSKTMKLFAERKMSARQVTQVFKNTQYAGPFRSLIRSDGGVKKATTLTRKALQRRNMI